MPTQVLDHLAGEIRRALNDFSDLENRRNPCRGALCGKRVLVHCWAYQGSLRPDSFAERAVMRRDNANLPPHENQPETPWERKRR
jgi:hypothetical protein